MLRWSNCSNRPPISPLALKGLLSLLLRTVPSVGSTGIPAILEGVPTCPRKSSGPHLTGLPPRRGREPKRRANDTPRVWAGQTDIAIEHITRCGRSFERSPSGHFDPFPPPRLKARCWIREATFARATGNEKDAPKAAAPSPAIMRRQSTLTGYSLHATPTGKNAPEPVILAARAIRVDFCRSPSP